MSITSAGTTIAISAGLPVAQDNFSYPALTYTTIGGVESIPAFGAQIAVNSFQPLNGPQEKHKGPVNYGSLQIPMALDKADAGQSLMAVAAEPTNNALYSFRVTFANGDQRHFQGRVFGMQETPGSAINVLMQTSTVEIGTKVVKVDGRQRLIDSVNGSDAFDGTTPAKAWQSFASWLALGTAISDVPLGLARGSMFASSTAFTVNNVRIGSYGPLTASRPIFDTSILCPAASWAADGTYAGMYNQTVGGMLVDAKNSGNVVFFNAGTGKYRIYQQYASKAALNAAPAGVYVSGWGTASVTISIKTGTNPGSDGVERRVTNAYGISITGDGAVIENLIFRNSGHQDGGLRIVSAGGALGKNATVRGCRFENGSRHNLVTGQGLNSEGNVYVGGRNDQEGNAGNGLTVFHNGDMSAESFVTRNDVFDADGYPFQGIFWHDAGSGAGGAANGLSLKVDCISPRFRGVVGGIGSNAVQVNVVSPICEADDTGQQTKALVAGSSAGRVTTTNLTGSLNQACYQQVGGGTLDFSGTRASVPDLGGGSAQPGFYAFVGASNETLNLYDEAPAIAPTLTTGAGGFASLIYWQRGTINANKVAPTLTGGEALGHNILWGIYGGFSGGTIAITAPSTPNAWPFAVGFNINGTSYPTLAAAQTAGFLAGDGYQLPKAPTIAFNFDGATANLEDVGWTRIAGAAGTLTRNSGKLAIASNSRCVYKLGDLPLGGRGVVTFTLTTLNTGQSGPAMCIADANNFIVVRSYGTAYDVKYCIADTGAGATLFASSGITPAVGDIVKVAVRVLDAAIGKLLIVMYVNQAGGALNAWRRVGAGQLTSLTLAAATGVGFHSWNNPLADVVDDLGFGPN